MRWWLGIGKGALGRRAIYNCHDEEQRNGEGSPQRRGEHRESNVNGAQLKLAATNSKANSGTPA